MQKANHFKLKPAANPLSAKPERKSTATEQIGSKMTSPTLVEFRNQNAQLPEWRLQLQNAVQQRMKNSGNADGAPSSPAGVAGPDKEAASTEAAPAGAATDNRHLSAALKRIESSRNRYLVTETPKALKKTADAPKKDFPFTIAARTDDLPIKTKETDPESKKTEPTKPKLVKKKKSVPIRDLYDTSELDPKFPPARLSSSFEAAPALEKKESEPEAPLAEIKAEAPIAKPAEPAPAAKEPETVAETGPEIIQEKAEEAIQDTNSIEEYDDYASLSLRFNAGIFDFLIGAFLSFVLLLPFVIAGGNWFTLTGLAAFAATCAIVMFVYLTASVGFAGKSFGMHIFSLEMIDIGGENYPSFHQSAVSAAVFLVSVACLGVGFATALFDRDRRAAHDLLSGTLVVREL